MTVPFNSLRHFKRTAKLEMYRTNVPADDTKFKVSQEGANGIEITDLRITFNVERSLKKNPNPCSIKITNLSPDSRKLLSNKPVRINLEAGYDGVSRLLFIGDMRYAHTTQDGPDIITSIECGDGDRVYRSARARASYGKGTTVKKVLRDLANSIGQDLPENIAASRELDRQLAEGTVLFGPVRNELTRLIAPFGYSWSLENGKLVILKDSETDGEYTISEETGMIGFPEVGSPDRMGKPPNISVKCLLFPELRPGARINLKSKYLSGPYKIERVVHTGDTHGDSWETEVELKQL